MRKRLITSVVALVAIVASVSVALASDSTLRQVGTTDVAGATYGSVPSPNGDFLYTVSLTDGAVETFARESLGQLSSRGTTSLPAGPVNGKYLDISPDGKSLAVSSSGSVTSFKVSPGTGALSSPQLIEDSAQTQLDSAYGVSFSADGRFLYVSDETSGAGAINVFARNAKTGALRFSSLYGGAGSDAPPNAIDVVEQAAGGGELYATVCDAGSPAELLVLRRNPRTGGLTRSQRILPDGPDSGCGYGIGAGRESVAMALVSRGGVVGFDRNPKNGRLTRANDIYLPDDLASASYIARPGGGSTFFLDAYDADAVGRFRITNDGTVSLAGIVGLGDGLSGVQTPYGISAIGKNLYVPGYDSASIATLVRG